MPRVYWSFPGQIGATERKRPSRHGESFCIIDSVPLAHASANSNEYLGAFDVTIESVIKPVSIIESDRVHV